MKATTGSPLSPSTTSPTPAWNRPRPAVKRRRPPRADEHPAFVGRERGVFDETEAEDARVIGDGFVVIADEERKRAETLRHGLTENERAGAGENFARATAPRGEETFYWRTPAQSRPLLRDFQSQTPTPSSTTIASVPQSVKVCVRFSARSS